MKEDKVMIMERTKGQDKRREEGEEGREYHVNKQEEKRGEEIMWARREGKREGKKNTD